MTDTRSFFEHYAEHYMASDVDTVAAMCEAPFLAVREGRAIHLADRAAVRAHLAGLMDAYARAGAARAEIASLDTLSLGPSGAVVTVNWHAVDAEGAMVRDFHTSYHLLRDGETWRILSYTNHA
jgi:hypothetical protein